MNGTETPWGLPPAPILPGKAEWMHVNDWGRALQGGGLEEDIDSHRVGHASV